MQSGVFWVDMALGPDDTPHILFYDPNLQNGSYHGVPKVRYAHRTSSAWETDIVETTILGYGWKHGSIRVAPDGTVHVAYLADVSYTGNSSTLRYGIRGPAGWTLQSVDAPPGMKGFNPNVMISPRCGLPRIGYFWLGATGGRSFLLRLAAYDGEKWLFEDIFDMNPPSGFSPNEFAVDGFDRTHLVFNHMVENASALYGTTSTLFYAVRQPIPCAAPSIQITNPPDGAVVPATPIAVDGTAAGNGSGLDRVEVSCDGGGTWAVANGNATWSFPACALLPGPNAIHARAFDDLGRESAPSVVTVVYDDAPPTVAVTSHADGQWTGAAAPLLGGTAADGVGLDRVEVSCDGGSTWAAAAGTAAWTAPCALAPGPNGIRARAFDRAGWESAHAAITLQYDPEAPEVAITSPPDGVWIDGTGTSVDGTAADLGSGLDRVEVSCDGGGTWAVAAGTAAWSFPCAGLVPGPNGIRARAFDRVGWESPHAVLTVNVDGTPPTVSIASPGDGVWINATAASVAGTAADGGSGLERVEVSCDGGATWNPATGTASWTSPCTGLLAGANVIHARSFDWVGWESAHAVVTVNVDLVAPVVTLTGPANNTFTNQDVTLTYAVTDNLDPAPTITGPASGTVYATEGPRTVTITATDAAGNSATASVTFTIDTTPPTIATTSPGNNTITNQNVTLTYTVADTQDPVPTVAGPASGTLFTAEGAQTVTITATDAAGNTATASVTFTIDKTPPAVTITAPANNTVTNQDAALSYTVTDNLDLAPIVVGPASGTVYSTEGLQTVTISATDAAGNSATASVTFTIDKTPPTLTVTCPPEAPEGSPASCTITATDDGGAPTLSWVVTRDGTWVAQGTGRTVAFPATAAGTYTVVVTATDAAGNAATARKTVTAVTPARPLLPALLLVLAAVVAVLFFLVLRRRRTKPEAPSETSSAEAETAVEATVRPPPGEDPPEPGPSR